MPQSFTYGCQCEPPCWVKLQQRPTWLLQGENADQCADQQDQGACPAAEHASQIYVSMWNISSHPEYVHAPAIHLYNAWSVLNAWTASKFR